MASRDYKTFLERLYQLRDYEKFTGKKIRYRIKPFAELLKYLDNPEKKLSFPIGITGTKGKGSTGAFLSSILKESNIKTGFFSSPHVMDIRERIQIDKKWIKEELFADVGNYVIDVVEENFPRSGFRTFFEIMTATGILSFIKENTEVQIFEVGLGGRLDATSLIPHKLVFITTIDLEHSKTLGKTLLDIAWEKVGLVKGQPVVIIGRQKRKYVEDFIVKKVRERGGYPIRFDEGIKKYGIKIIDEFTIKWKGMEIKPSLWGKHQMLNASMAIIGSMKLKEKGFNIDKYAVKRGVEKAVWRGRLDIISKDPLIIVDGGHTPDAVKYAFESIVKKYPDKKIKVLLSVLRDKKIVRISDIVKKYSKCVYLTEVDHKRKMPIEKLESFFPNYCYSSPFLNEVYQYAKININVDELLLVIGSLYLAGDILNIEKGENDG